MVDRSIPGGYVLSMHACRNLRIRIGALGTCAIREVLYYYGGSARRGIGSRIQRHARPTKPRHWHIDYLTTRSDIRVLEAWCYPEQFDTEHQLQYLPQVDLENILPGFGAGDCAEGCPSHLWHASDKLFPEDISADYYIVSF
ncbi:MAG TPA: GIY-YIG nuclease family protein [bacterium]|nr:GIY-YIG nuclease family protein [bacterium]